MIVGLGYIAGSGKTEVANYLIKEYSFKKISFADTLKKGCMKIFGLTHEQVYGNLKEVVDDYWNQTPRYILQKVGTDCLRNVYDKDIWIKAAFKKISLNFKENWIFDDVRFPNEAKAIKEHNGILIRIDRLQAGANGGISSHSSETAMSDFDSWDYIIDNSGNSLVELYNKTDKLIKEIL